MMLQFGQMLYLLTQTLGMWHESQRYDRDQYVTINANNIAAGSEGNLGIIDQSAQLLLTYGFPYDYASIMQYPPQVASSKFFVSVFQLMFTVLRGLTRDYWAPR
jgi:hypothetical protein